MKFKVVEMKHVFHGSRSICSLIFAVILIGPLTFYSDTIESSPVESDQVRLVDTPLDRPPLALPNGLGGGFVQNDGQLPDPDILFYYDIPGCSYYFLKDGVMISLVDRGRPSHPTPTEAYRFPVPGGPVLEEGVRTDDIGYTSVCHIFFSFEGSRGVRPEGVDPMTGHFNYLRGMDKDSWITNVHSFSRIVYEEVYRGIDLVFYLKEGLLVATTRILSSLSKVQTGYPSTRAETWSSKLSLVPCTMEACKHSMRTTPLNRSPVRSS